MEIEIGFIAGVLRRDRKNLDALRALADNYSECGQFVETLEMDERLVSLCPKDPRAHYNLACGYALNRDWSQAAASLCRAIQLGYRDVAWLMKDADLERFRRQTAFKKILAQLCSARMQGELSSEK